MQHTCTTRNTHRLMVGIASAKWVKNCWVLCAPCSSFLVTGLSETPDERSLVRDKLLLAVLDAADTYWDSEEE